MSELVFNVTAAGIVAASDGSLNVGSPLVANSSLVRVPTRLVVYKPAGTAYTVSAGSNIKVKDDDGNILFMFPLEGFLDSASSATRVFTPRGGLAFAANSAQFSFAVKGTVSGGTDLQCRLTFDEVKAVF